MLRLTISVNKPLAEAFDQLIKRKGFRNRSEAFRDLLRKALRQELPPNDSKSTHASASTATFACISYVHTNQAQRARRPTITNDRIGADAYVDTRVGERANVYVISSTLTPLDDGCNMATLIVRGSVDALVALADSISAETSVRHCQLNLAPMDASAMNTDV